MLIGRFRCDRLCAVPSIAHNPNKNFRCLFTLVFIGQYYILFQLYTTMNLHDLFVITYRLALNELRSLSWTILQPLVSPCLLGTYDFTSRMDSLWYNVIQINIFTLVRLKQGEKKGRKKFNVMWCMIEFVNIWDLHLWVIVLVRTIQIMRDKVNKLKLF